MSRPLLIALAFALPVTAADDLPAGAVGRLGPTRFRHLDAPWEVVYAPDGKLLASYVVHPSTIYLWDPETGKLLHRLATGTDVAYPVLAFTPDHKYLGGYWRVWDTVTGKEVLKPDGDVRAFAADGTRLACQAYRKVIVWDFPNREKLREVPGDFLAISADGKRLTTRVEKQVTVWDAQTGEERHKLPGTFVNHAAGRLVACQEAKELTFWDTATGKATARVPAVANDTYYTNYPYHGFSADGKRFAALEPPDPIYHLQHARVWDTDTGEKLRTIGYPEGRSISGLRLSPDGKTVATMDYVAGGTSAIGVWDVASGKRLYGCGAGNRATFSPDGKRLATAEGHSLRLWDPTTGRKVVADTGPLYGVRYVDFSYDQRLVGAVYDDDGGMEFREWDAAGGKNRSFGRMVPSWRTPSFPSAARRLLFIQGGGLTVLEVGREDQPAPAAGPPSTVQWIGYDPDSRHVTALELRSSATDKLKEFQTYEPVFRFLDAISGKDAAEADRPRWARSLQGLKLGQLPDFLAFSLAADFRVLAVAPGGQKKVRLIEVVTGKDLPACELESGVRALALSPDSRLLAAVTQDGRLRFWDVAGGKEVASRPSPHGLVTCVAFAPDGKTVAVGYTDTTVVLWEVPGLPKPAPLAADDPDRLWADLASDDPAKAYPAAAKLRSDPDGALKLFKAKLRPVAAEAPPAVARLIADLDADRFAVREAASAGLEKVGQDAVGGLRKAMAGKLSAEGAERAGKVLAALRDRVSAPEDLRRLRAVQVLEQLGSGPAVELLKAVAAGPAEAWVTLEAQEAVLRLPGRR